MKQVVVAESLVKEVKLSLMDDSRVFLETSVYQFKKEDTSEYADLYHELEVSGSSYPEKELARGVRVSGS